MSIPNEKDPRVIAAKQIDPGSNCEYALHEREPMTHEIVRSIAKLTARLAKHQQQVASANVERRKVEAEILDRVLEVVPVELFLHNTDWLIAKRGGQDLWLAPVGEAPVWRRGPRSIAVAQVLESFTLVEVLSGLVAAIAERIDNKHEAGKKAARAVRKLRGILNLLDNS